MKNQNWSFGSVAQMARGGLRRVLGISDLFAIGYGDLGSSIYYALGITAVFALGATPIALGLAGIVFICTALTYAEMTSTFHESGGSASFARHAFNDLISFIAGWGLLLDYIVTIAISSFAVGPYLAYFYPDLKIVSVQTGFTIGLIFILYAINFLGVKQSTKISFILTGFTILTQVAIIFIGTIFLMNIPYIIDHMRINVPNVDWSPSWPEFWKGTAMAMVAYTGIESIAQLGAEAKRPSFSVPRAIIITMFVLIIMYFGISALALSVVSPKDLGTKYLMDPIAGIAAALPFGSSVLSPWIGILAAVILFVAANAGLIGASRLSFNMGEYYQLPRIFYRVHARFRTPYVALAFFAIIAALVVLWSRGKMTFLADLYNFGAMLAFFSAHLSLIVLRIKKPELKRPFRVPLNIPFKNFSIPLTAIIGCFATAAVWVLIVITKPEGRYLGLAWIAFGILMFFAYRRKQRFSAMGQLKIQRIKMPHYKPMKIKNILVPTRGGVQTETVQMACEIAKLHGARISAVYVLDVPYSMPLDSNLAHRELIAESILKRTEAIAREFGVGITLQILRARSIPTAILESLAQSKYDLLVLGAMKSRDEAAHKGLGAITEKILREAPCRVWVCASDYKGKHSSTNRLLPFK
jgi:basic amino acid/polyamine antiporter, APA family